MMKASDTESIFPKRSALGRFFALSTVTVNVACTILDHSSSAFLFSSEDRFSEPCDQPSSASAFPADLVLEPGVESINKPPRLQISDSLQTKSTGSLLSDLRPNVWRL